MKQIRGQSRILLIDGHNVLFKAFYGIPARIRGIDGKPIHAVLGFIGTVRNTLISFEPDYLLVVFDSEAGSFREHINPAYKSNRKKDYSGFPDEQNPFSQLHGIKTILDHLRWRHCEVAGVESDDVLAAYSRDYQNTHEVIIVSTDSDLLQLVSEHTSVFSPRGRKSVLYTPEKILEEFQVAPNLLPDLKALMGDKSDNIQGVPGIGFKTAKKLVNQFGTIEDLYSKVTSIFPVGLQNRLAGSQSDVQKNVLMIRLTSMIGLPFDLEDLQIDSDSWQRKTMQILAEAGLIG